MKQKDSLTICPQKNNDCHQRQEEGNKMWMKNFILEHIYAIICILAVLVYLVTAINSVGYIHPDEHFQIIEFAQWKLGNNTSRALAWEYGSQIRPTLQPVLAMGVFRCCGWVGMDNPFHQATLLRIMMALLMLLATGYYVRAAKEEVFPRYHSAFYALSLLFWLLPVINVRFSSETMSSLCLLLLLANMVKYKLPTPLCAFMMGVVAGLGFEFRFQFAFALLGLGLWALLVCRYGWRAILSVLGGFTVVILSCTLLDSWFYGNFVFTPYQYFHVNIIEKVAANFGVSPWYGFLLMLLYVPTLIFGIALLLSLVIGSVRHYRSPMVWAFMSFLICHSLVAHKELRFLFPVMPLVPLFLIWGYETVGKHLNKVLKVVLLFLLFTVNTGGLVLMMSKPAGEGKTAMMQYVCSQSRAPQGVTLSATEESNPFWESYLVPDFYQWSPVRVDNIDALPHEKKGTVVVLTPNDSVHRERILRQGFVETYRSVPQWLEKLNAFYQTYDAGRVLIAYEKE